MKLYGVYTQWYPTWKYDETLESLWTTEEAAVEAAKKYTSQDYVWVREILADQEDMNGEDGLKQITVRDKYKEEDPAYQAACRRENK